MIWWSWCDCGPCWLGRALWLRFYWVGLYLSGLTAAVADPATTRSLE